MSNIERFKCLTTDSVVEAMKRIDMNSQGILYVVDTNDVLVGCITDGDIRRWLINGKKIKGTVEEVMNTCPIYVLRDNIGEGHRIMRERQINSIAVIDDKGRVVDVIFSTPQRTSLEGDCLKGVAVIVMAGGKGTRLYPYTKILPKPLIPIGEIPIVERIMDRFFEVGVNDFYLTINYRKEMIKSYFSDSLHDYRIHYIEENTPLGTAGSIQLIREHFVEPIIVTNCDILIDGDYNDMMKYHKRSGNTLTVISSLKNTVIPYGVLYSKEKGIIDSIQEKPEISNFVNTGMYIMNPETIKYIPSGTPFDMTDLISILIKEGKQVGMYPISESAFLDMGEFAEMKKMEERINAGLK